MSAGSISPTTTSPTRSSSWSPSASTPSSSASKPSRSPAHGGSARGSASASAGTRRPRRSEASPTGLPGRELVAPQLALAQLDQRAAENALVVLAARVEADRPAELRARRGTRAGARGGRAAAGAARWPPGRPCSRPAASPRRPRPSACGSPRRAWAGVDAGVVGRTVEVEDRALGVGELRDDRLEPPPELVLVDVARAVATGVRFA